MRPITLYESYNESATFFIQNVLFNDITNALKWTVSRKKMTKKVDFYVHLNSIDAHSAMSINIKTCLVLLEECRQLLVFV